MGTAAAIALLVVCASCEKQPQAQPPEARLAAFLQSDPKIIPLDRASFDRIVVEPFRRLYDDYVARFAAAPPASSPSPFAVRRQFAGDPALTRSEARLRWALPVMYPAYVVTTLDTVFVEVDGHWHALSGLDDALLERVRMLDAACAFRLELAGPPGPCSDVGWVVADAALRGDKARLDHACALAATACLR